MAMSPRMEPVQGDPNDPHTLLKAVFQYYCRFGRTGAKGRSEKTLGTLCYALRSLLDLTIPLQIAPISPNSAATAPI